jgi:hypothetical protein
MKIWPGKLYIEIKEWDEKIDEISHPIQITNPYNYGINVTTKKEIPNNTSLEGGYSIIPDASWIDITPDIIFIPPKESREFNAFVKVPEDDQKNHYNEKWDLRAVFNSDIYLGSEGGVQFQIELAVKLLIKTPEQDVEKSQNIPIFLILIVIGLGSIIVFFISKNKLKKSEYAFYFKKKKK